MSSINDVVKAASDLNQTVANECKRIDQKLKELEDFKRSILDVQDQTFQNGSVPVWRLSRNQLGSITNGKLDFYMESTGFDVTYEIYKEIKAITDWDDRDNEEKELLTAMGKDRISAYVKDFNIIKVTWKTAQPGEVGMRSLARQKIRYNGWITHGCYAKLLKGKAYRGFLEGVSDQWKLCGESYHVNKRGYAYSYPVVLSESGEILFCLAASVAGKMILNPEKPEWGYFPYLQQLED